MSTLHRKAGKLEEDGKLEEASRLYAESAFKRLNGADFETGNQMWHAITNLVESISSATRAGRVQRALGLRKVMKSVVELAASYRGPDNRCLQGLLQEWLGDVALMTDSDDALDFYDSAAEYYEGISESDQRFWGWEEEFDYEYWAFKRFLSTEGYGEQAEELPNTDFEKRIELKREIATELLSSE